MSHKHKWQFADEYQRPKDTFRFVCECGKYKFVNKVHIQ